MKQPKSLTLAGRRYTPEQLPLVCTPIVASTASGLKEETAKVLAKQPDIIEWRVDFFDHIADTEAVIAVAKDLKLLIGEVPLLLTRRARHEGGESIPLDEAAVVALYKALCSSGSIDLIDYELSNPREHLAELISVAHQQGVQLIASYHNFEQTPPADELVALLAAAEAAGADFGKVAVMPQRLEDILVLLEATLKADQQLQIPLITISMGPYGSLTRIIAGAFGSSLTFAVGSNSSAPGQISIEDVQQALAILRRSITLD